MPEPIVRPSTVQSRTPPEQMTEGQINAELVYWGKVQQQISGVLPPGDQARVNALLERKRVVEVMGPGLGAVRGLFGGAREALGEFGQGLLEQPEIEGARLVAQKLGLGAEAEPPARGAGPPPLTLEERPVEFGRPRRIGPVAAATGAEDHDAQREWQLGILRSITAQFPELPAAQQQQLLAATIDEYLNRSRAAGFRENVGGYLAALGGDDLALIGGETDNPIWVAYNRLQQTPGFARALEDALNSATLEKDREDYGKLLGLFAQGLTTQLDLTEAMLNAGIAPGSPAWTFAMSNFKALSGQGGGGGGRSALDNALDAAQLRILQLQGDDLARRYDLGGASPFELDQWRENIRQFNLELEGRQKQTDLQRQQLLESIRSNKVGEFLQAQGLLGQMAGSLIPASAVGRPLPGFEAGGPVEKASKRLGVTFTPSTIQGRSISPLLELAERVPS